MRVNKKKEHILDAAEALMCGIPDKDISVEMIAGKAGIAKGSIYRAQLCNRNKRIFCRFK